jgi:hypothetical protein
MDGTEETKLLGDGEGDEPASSATEKEPSLVVGCAKVNEEVTDSCLCGLKALSFATMLAGALVMAVNVFEIVDFQESYQAYALRGYATLFGLLIVLAELERPRLLLDYCRFLEFWSLKGLFVVFVGVLTLDTEADNNSALQTSAAIVVCALGAVYFVFGLFCVKSYRDYRKQGLHAGVEKKLKGPAPPARAAEPDPPRAPPRPTAGADAPSWLDPRQDMA